jgi:hypothetical protein
VARCDTWYKKTITQLLFLSMERAPGRHAGGRGRGAGRGHQPSAFGTAVLGTTPAADAAVAVGPEKMPSEKADVKPPEAAPSVEKAGCDTEVREGAAAPSSEHTGPHSRPVANLSRAFVAMGTAASSPFLLVAVFYRSSRLDADKREAESGEEGFERNEEEFADVVHEYVYPWMPLFLGAVLITSLCRPTDNSVPYLLFHAAYLALFVVLPAVFFLKHLPDEASERRLMWTVLLLLPLVQLATAKLRRHIAGLARPDPERLSKFLTQKLLLGGLSMLTLVTLLTFESLSCIVKQDFETLHYCRGTFISQTALSLYLLTYLLAKLLAGTAPARVLNRHLIQPQHLATFSLTPTEAAKAVCLAAAGACSLFLVANLQTQRELPDGGKFLVAIAAIGGGALATAVGWTAAEVGKDMYTGTTSAEETPASPASIPQLSPPQPPNSPPIVTELSYVYPAFSFAFLCVHVIAQIYYLFTLNESVRYIGNIFAPLNILFYMVSMFAKPKRSDSGYLKFMRGHLFLALVFEIFLNRAAAFALDGDAFAFLVTLVASTGASVAYAKFGLGLRDVVAKLPAKELSDFLTHSLVSATIKLVGPLLFLAFNPVRCLLEEDFDVTNCRSIVIAQTNLSGYALAFTAMRVMIAAVARCRQEEPPAWTIEKVATMDLTKVQKIEGTFVLAAGLCGLWLFSVVISEAPAELTDAEARFARIVGAAGNTILFLVFLLEGIQALTSTLNKEGGEEEGTVDGGERDETGETGESGKENSNAWIVLLANPVFAVLGRNAMQQDETGGVALQPIAPKKPKPVTKVSGSWVIFSVVLTSIMNAYMFAFTITGDIKYNQRANVIWVMAGAMWFITVFMQPRNEGKLYKTWLYGHFFCQVVLSELCFGIACAVKKEYVKILLTLLRVVLFQGGFGWCLKIRGCAAELDDDHLSQYLTATILRGTLESLPPLILLALEVVGCTVENGDETCASAAFVSMSLSWLLMGSTIISVIDRSAPRQVQRSVGITLNNLATFRLRARQKLQIGLLFVSALCAAYMFPYVGAEGSEVSDSVYYAAAVGALSMWANMVVENIVFARAVKGYEEGREERTRSAPMLETTRDSTIVSLSARVLEQDEGEINGML